MNRKSDQGSQDLTAEYSELEAVGEQLRTTRELAAELERSNRPPNNFFCLNCEMERQDGLYFSFLFWGLLAGFLRRGNTWPYELMAAWAFGGSVVCGLVTARWRWEQFKRRNDWRSPTDNKIYRQVHGCWKQWF